MAPAPHVNSMSAKTHRMEETNLVVVLKTYTTDVLWLDHPARTPIDHDALPDLEPVAPAVLPCIVIVLLIPPATAAAISTLHHLGVELLLFAAISAPQLPSELAQALGTQAGPLALDHIGGAAGLAAPRQRAVDAAGLVAALLDLHHPRKHLAHAAAVDPRHEPALALDQPGLEEAVCQRGAGKDVAVRTHVEDAVCRVRKAVAWVAEEQDRVRHRLRC